MNDLREAAVQEALTWLRTPYHHMARVKGAGCDCATLLLEVYHTIGAIPEIDIGYYPQDWHFHRNDERYLGWIKKYAKQVDVPQKGDIALFRFGRCVSHGAIVTDWPNVIHSYHKQGVIFGSINDVELKGRLDSVWSLWGDE